MPRGAKIRTKKEIECVEIIENTQRTLVDRWMMGILSNYVDAQETPFTNIKELPRKTGSVE